MAVDTDWPLLGVIVHADDVQDANGLQDLLERLKPFHCWLRAISASLARFLFGLTPVVVRRAAGVTGFVVQPRRWVVERTRF